MRHSPSPFRAALRSRRGATAAMLAVTASLLLGASALAVEGGMLMLRRQQAQTAADLAAIAAATATPVRGAAQGVATGRETAAANGFPSGVVVRTPPASGGFAGRADAFEATVEAKVPLALARFLSSGPEMTVSARAVAVSRPTAPVCLLALHGMLTIANSSRFDAPGCAIGSTGPGNSISIPQSNSAVVALQAVAANSCQGCGDRRWSFARGFRENDESLGNPYAQLDAKAHSAFSGAGCVNTAPLSSRGPIQPTGFRRAYCANVGIANTSAVTMQPGTYVFQNAGLEIGSISSFACRGCTFVFIGAAPGRLSISNTSSVTISAPAANPDDSDYDGMLFHRVGHGPAGSAGQPMLNLQSVSDFNLTGGIYFPNAYARVGNVSSSTQQGCLAVVAGTIEIQSLSSYRMDVSQCAATRTAVPSTRVARLVE